MMDRFQLMENKGRELLASFLKLYTDQVEFTKDRYCPVDVYFTLQDKKAVGEIKVRDKKYEEYYTHLIETKKLKSIILLLERNLCHYGFYFCFFGTDSLYIYNVNDIVKYSWEDSKEMPLTTAEYSGKIWKGVQKIPTAKAVVFRLNNGIWSRFK